MRFEDSDKSFSNHEGRRFSLDDNHRYTNQDPEEDQMLNGGEDGVLSENQKATHSNFYISSKPKIKLGMIPLTDAAPFLVAKEKGFFERQGINVSLSRENSWASLRDKVAYGVLDGGQMLAPMPLAATLKLGPSAQSASVHDTDIVVPCSLDLNGNAITLSMELYDALIDTAPALMESRKTSALALKQYIDFRKQQGQKRLRFAMVYPYSTHHYELRYWLASAGIDPDRDVELRVVAPPRMAESLALGDIDGYCVGEPWNTVAVSQGIGRVVITKYEIWNNSPEKVLGMRRPWVKENPNSLLALLYGLIEAGQWLDQTENREEAARLLSGPHLIHQPFNLIEASLKGNIAYTSGEHPEYLPDFHVFSRYAAMFPFHSDGVWMLTQMIRWGQIEKPINIHATVKSVYMTEIFRQAARDLNMKSPEIDMKQEGLHVKPWDCKGITLGPDMFFDEMRFNPFMPLTYLRKFKIGRFGQSEKVMEAMSTASNTSTCLHTEDAFEQWLEMNP